MLPGTTAELNKSLKEGDTRHMLLRLQAAPNLMSITCASAGTLLHVACEAKQVKAVQQVFGFLSCSSLAVQRAALQPYCSRTSQPLPSSITEGLRMAANITNAKGQTPLMYACFAGCPDLVKLLLAQEADPWLGDRCGGRTALHYAAMAGSADCIATLFAHLPARHMARQGVRYVNARSTCGLTPLHYAVFFGKEEAVKELLTHDPRLNAMTSSDSYDLSIPCDALSTPLHFAAVRGNTACARLLLEHLYAQNVRRAGSQAPLDQDPRLLCNHGKRLPWQVAAVYHPASRDLVSLLHPGQPLARVLGVGRPGQPGGSSPLDKVPTLASLAAAVLRGKLLEDVQAAAREAEPVARSSSQAGAKDDDEEFEGVCGVCFDRCAAVTPAACGHGLCGECAAAVCRGLTHRPVQCPFCRRAISGFQPLRDRPGRAAA